MKRLPPVPFANATRRRPLAWVGARTPRQARRVRARMQVIMPGAAQSRQFVAIGRIVGRAPFVREWSSTRATGLEADALAGRCVVMAGFGAFALGSSSHGGRSLAAIPLGAIAGWHVGAAVNRRTRRAAETEAQRALPHLIDRLATCVLAGTSVERALRMCAPETPGVLGAAVADGLRALDAGVARARAYERIGERAGVEDARRLMASLARAERFGTSVSETLLAQAGDLRSRARAAAEAESRTAPVKLVFPLVFCFLPAFLVLTIAPIAISALRTIGGL